MPESKAESIRVHTEHQGGFDILEANCTYEGRQIQVTGWLSPESGLDGIHSVFAGVVHIQGHGHVAKGHPRGRSSRALISLRRMVLEREGDRMRVTLAGETAKRPKPRPNAFTVPARRVASSTTVS